MKNKWLISLAGLASCIASSTLFAATQNIVASPSNFNVSAEETVEFSLLYPEGNPEATGVGVQIFFDSTKLEFIDSKDLLETAFTHISTASTDDTDHDNNDETDSKIVASFGVPSGFFIESGDMPSSLLIVTFKAKDNFDSETAITFAGTAGAGHEVTFTPLEIGYKDNVAPVVIAPVSLTVEATGETTAIDLGAATAIDAVDGDLVAVASNTGPFAVGTHTVRWTVSDNAGNTGTAEQLVTVNDSTAPVVTAPESLTVEATGETTTVELGAATVVDAVDSALVAVADNTGTFTVGTHTVKWTASDSAGNTGTAEQLVTVRDTTSPVVTAPNAMNIEATGEMTAVDLGVAVVVDAVDSDLFATPDKTGPFTIGTHTIIWTVFDSVGNTGTAEQLVTVSDTTAPVVTAPESLTVEATGDTTIVELGTATVIDVVDSDLVAVADKTGPFAVGTHTVTWTASDSAGNTGTAEQVITVNEVVKSTKKDGGGSVPLFFLLLLSGLGFVGRYVKSHKTVKGE